MSKRFWIILSGWAFITLILITSACQLTPTAEKITTQLTMATPTAAVIAITSAKSLPSTTSLPAPLRSPLWTFTTQGEVWSSPAFLDGVVYFGSDDHFLYAVEVATHQLKWKFETGGIVRSRPAVTDWMIYITSDDNNLYALDAQTGKMMWRFDMGEALITRLPITESWDYQQSSPAVANGVVFVGSANSNFYAVDAMTGLEKWRAKIKMWVRSSPTVVEGVVYFGDWYGWVYALDSQNGQVIWHYSTGDAVVPSPTVVDGVVYIGSKSPCLFALDSQTGQKKWCFSYPISTPWVESSARVENGVVYVGSAAWKRLNVLDAATGQLKWYFSTKGYPFCSPAVESGVVYIGATNDYFYAVDAETGEEIWKVETGNSLTDYPPAALLNGGVVSSPVVVDKVVYFGSLDGNLYAVSTAP